MAGSRRRRTGRAAEPGDQRSAELAEPGEHQVSLTVGSEEAPQQQAVRAVFGEATQDKGALVDALRARELELTEWLQDPANRERLLGEPRDALAEVVPEEALAGIDTATMAAELQERLRGLEFHVYNPPKTPAMELFEKVWAWVAASPGNLTAFNADVAGTVRGVDPAAPKAVVDEVIAAIQKAQGIERLVPFVVTPTQFAQTVSAMAPGSSLGPRP